MIEIRKSINGVTSPEVLATVANEDEYNRWLLEHPEFTEVSNNFITEATDSLPELTITSNKDNTTSTNMGSYSDTRRNTNYSFGDWLNSIPSSLNRLWNDVLLYDPIVGQRRVNNFNRVSRSNPYFMNNWDILNNNLEMLNIGGLGLLNKLSLSQLWGFGRDLYNGKNIMDSWYNINSGFFTDEYMAQHPILANAVNLAGDILIPYGASKIFAGTRLANAPRVSRAINSELPKSEIPYSTNNLNNLRKFPSIYDNTVSDMEAIDIYANSAKSPQLDGIANLYYREEIFPRLTSSYPPVPEGTTYPVGNWPPDTWTNRRLDLNKVYENIPTDLHSLIPNGNGDLIRVTEPITLIYDYGNLRKMGFGYIEDHFNEFGKGARGVSMLSTEGERVPFILPAGTKLPNTGINSTAIHEMASHGTDGIIPILALKNYELIGRLLGFLDRPVELRATVNLLRHLLKGKNVDNLADDDLIMIFSEINGYSDSAIRRAVGVLKIPDEKIAEYIRYMVKYLPSAAPFYFIGNNQEEK